MQAYYYYFLIFLILPFHSFLSHEKNDPLIIRNGSLQPGKQPGKIRAFMDAPTPAAAREKWIRIPSIHTRLHDDSGGIYTERGRHRIPLPF